MFEVLHTTGAFGVMRGAIGQPSGPLPRHRPDSPKLIAHKGHLRGDDFQLVTSMSPLMIRRVTQSRVLPRFSRPLTWTSLPPGVGRLLPDNEKSPVRDRRTVQLAAPTVKTQP